MNTRFLLLFILLFGVQVAMAAESATVVRATQLVDAPYADAASHGVLRGETPVDVLERKGGWYHVKTEDRRDGWVRLSSIRLGAAEKEERGGFWASLFSSTGRSQTRTASATTGIRGLSEEEIHGAAPDAKAVERLATFAADDAQVRGFAGEIGLTAQPVDALPKRDDKSTKSGRRSK